jgi:predicted O-methyltransferase YrrM
MDGLPHLGACYIPLAMRFADRAKRWVWRLPVLRNVLARLDRLEAEVATLSSRLEQTQQPHPKAKKDSDLEVAVGIGEHWEAWAERLGGTLEEEQLCRLLLGYQQLVGRLAFAQESRAARFFAAAQRAGYSLVPANYESPIPMVDALPPWIWQHRYDKTPGFAMDPERQWELLERLAPWARELAETPLEAEEGYFWANGAFGPAEAVVYYGMIREFKPRRVLEVGAGYSTLVALQAASRNGTTTVEAVDPHPRPFLRSLPGLSRLWDRPVQQVPLAHFERLKSNDILFIDSSHVCTAGSDVNFLVFEVLPRLEPGVLVHFHDIFLPWDYPEPWIKDRRIFYNEQYLLLAFLMFNDAFEVLVASRFLTMTDEDRFRRLFPFLPWVKACSFWLRRR